MNAGLDIRPDDIDFIINIAISSANPAKNAENMMSDVFAPGNAEDMPVRWPAICSPDMRSRPGPNDIKRKKLINDGYA